VAIGPVRTSTRMGMHALLPMPAAEPVAMRTMLFAEMEEDAPPPPRYAPVRPILPADALMARIAAPAGPGPLGGDENGAPAPAAATPLLDQATIAQDVMEILAEMMADPASTYQPAAMLYQDFTVRCRMRRMARVPLDLGAFRRRFAMAQAGMIDPADPRWDAPMAVAQRLPDDMLAPFLLIAHAAIQGGQCPDDDALARAYGTSSPGRVRRLIDYMEKQGVIVGRTDFGGRRSIGIPELGLSTAAV
ncbi:MAG: ATP-binding protein, partial [Sphingopyxis sp.]